MYILVSTTPTPTTTTRPPPPWMRKRPKSTTLSSDSKSSSRRVPITLAPDLVTSTTRLGNHEKADSKSAIVETFLSSSMATNNIMDTSEAPVMVTIDNATTSTSTTTTTLSTTTTTFFTTTKFVPNEKEDQLAFSPPFGGNDAIISPPPGSGYCRPDENDAEDLSEDALNWNWARPGTVAVMPCPRGAAGMARWECNPRGRFVGQRPDLSQCRSVWLKRLYERLQTDDDNQQRESIVLLANEMLHHMVRKEFAFSSHCSFLKVIT